MKIRTQQSGAVTIVRPEGPIISEDADLFKTDVLRAIHENLGRIVVDAAKVTYVDSKGLEVLLAMTEELRRGGQTLRLCTLNGTVREVLDLTGLSSEFEYYDDPNTAVRSFLA